MIQHRSSSIVITRDWVLVQIVLADLGVSISQRNNNIAKTISYQCSKKADGRARGTQETRT